MASMLRWFALLCVVPWTLTTVNGQTTCTYNDSLSIPGQVQILGNLLNLRDVPEYTPIGSTLITILVNNPQQTQLALSDPGDFADLFTFEPVSRNLTVNSRIYYREMPVKLKFNCTDLVSQLQSDLTLLISFTDNLNDFPPVFSNEPYYTAISEYTPVGTTVLNSILATDADNSSPQITYAVLPGPYASHFDFPLPAQGKLVLRKAVDYEQVRSITLHIMAIDNHIGSNVRRSANTTVEIAVLDESDENPRFTWPTYMTTITETDTRGTLLVFDPPIRAWDPDVQHNSTLTYSIVADNFHDHDYFSINNETGALTLENDSVARSNKFCFLVQATKADNPSKVSQALVRVYVQATNSEAPSFLQQAYTAMLVENTLVGSPVVTVSAVDSDQSTVLRYSFLDSTTEFSVDTITGQITTAALLNFDLHESYRLRVRVTDGQYYGDTTVNVEVVPVNKHNPQFTYQRYTVPASEIREGQPFLRLQSRDSDQGSVISYSFLSNETYTNFSLDVISGNIHSLVAVEQSYSFVVIATDNQTPARQGSCLVQIVAPLVVPETPKPAARRDTGESNMAAVIALSVLTVLFFIALIILSVYICRKLCSDESSSKSRCVRSQSFEQNPMNFSSKNYKSYLQPSVAHDYKPNPDRHLQLYHGVVIEDSTSTQENPFNSQNSLDQDPDIHGSDIIRCMNSNDMRNLPTHSAAVNSGLFPQRYQLDGATTGESMIGGRQSRSTLPVDSGSHLGNAQTHAQTRTQIEYDTAVYPMKVEEPERLNAFHGAFNKQYPPPQQTDLDMEGSQRSSFASEHSYHHGEITSFKVGSTQHLVPPTHSLPKSSTRSVNKGSGNISFVDNSPTNSMYSSMTSQVSGLDPSLALEQHGRSGITVYY